MIPVAPQPEPATFDHLVRQRGLRWLRKRKIDLAKPLPAKAKLASYWRACLDDLHASYGGICAYLSIHVERCTGGICADHYVAKSRLAGLAYEWSNYRLASTIMNARKREYDDVLDPFTLRPQTFRLELVTGRIYSNPSLPAAESLLADETIARLGLDSSECREMRARRYKEYGDGHVTADYLRRYSPFIWAEAERQGLL